MTYVTPGTATPEPLRERFDGFRVVYCQLEPGEAPPVIDEPAEGAEHER